MNVMIAIVCTFFFLTSYAFNLLNLTCLQLPIIKCFWYNRNQESFMWFKTFNSNEETLNFQDKFNLF